MIREADRSDLDRILELYEHIPEDTILKESMNLRGTWELILNAPSHHVIVCEWDEKIVASCVCVFIPRVVRNMRPYAFIEHVVTYGEYRDVGCCVECLVYAKQLAIENHCYKMMIPLREREESCGIFSNNLANSMIGKKEFVSIDRVKAESLVQYILHTQYKVKRNLYDTYEALVADTMKALSNVCDEPSEALAKYEASSRHIEDVRTYFNKKIPDEITYRYLPADEYMELSKSKEGEIEKMYEALKQIADSNHFRMSYGGSGLYKLNQKKYDDTLKKYREDILVENIYGSGDCCQHLTYTPGYGYTIIDVGDRGIWHCACFSEAGVDEDYDTIVFYDGEFDAVFQALSRHIRKRE